LSRRETLRLAPAIRNRAPSLAALIPAAPAFVAAMNRKVELDVQHAFR
jgi:hypothetical protein